MTRSPVALAVDDVSNFAKTLRRQIKASDGVPSHVELLNMLARAAGHRNFQHLRAGKQATMAQEPVDATQAPDLVRIKRAVGHFDTEGRLLRWPSRRSHQELALWALWSQFPSGISLDDAAVKHFLVARHDFGDHALLRRELVDMRLLARTADGRDYRRIERRPPPEALALIRRLNAVQPAVVSSTA